ncbi:hypothetical protein G9P44_004039 [Scheffersomyces stipitis]|nr:hypothetical protein G9P44_004039 [Scheffersomyces stipitis]
MSEYNSNTVAQLKDLLKERGLTTDGKKADLVNRLIEADSTKQEEPEVAEAEPEAVVAPIAAENEATEVIAEDSAPVADEDATLTVVQPVTKEEPKVLSAEERKQLAIELLNKKVQRAVKFGDESAAEAARKDLVRVEKFGVELGTALAREIGLVDKSLGDGHRRKFNNKRRNSNNNSNNNRKNFKPKHNKRK